MSKEDWQKSLDDDLGRRLKDESNQQRPQFSEPLHTRIVDSIPTDSVRRGLFSRVIAIESRWRIAGTAAAALLLLGVLVVWKTNALDGKSSQTSGTVAQSVEKEQDVRQVAIDTLSRADGAEFSAMVDETIAKRQWAYLDHDAKVVADLLVDQLPFTLALAER